MGEVKLKQSIHEVGIFSSVYFEKLYAEPVCKLRNGTLLPRSAPASTPEPSARPPHWRPEVHCQGAFTLLCEYTHATSLLQHYYCSLQELNSELRKVDWCPPMTNAMLASWIPRGPPRRTEPCRISQVFIMQSVNVGLDRM
jgi:hypothetical protein